MDFSKPPIFIVGYPRSGTTLLSAMLASHSNIDCGPETHFFSKKMSTKATEYALKDPRWPKIAVSNIGSIKLSGLPVHELFQLSLDNIENYLQKCAPSEQNMLESLTRQHAFREGKERWAEKTPNHILHLVKIRSLYPDAQVVRIIRDPRDSAASMVNLPWTSNSLINNAYLILRWYQNSRSFFERDPKTYTLQYEDLVANPSTTMQALCKFLNEDFEDIMLDTSKSSKKVAPKHESWKNSVGKSLDSSRCYAWKNELDTADILSISNICQPIISDFRYLSFSQNLQVFTGYYLSRSFVESQELLFKKLAESKAVIIPDDINSKSRNERIIICDIPSRGNTYFQQAKAILKLLNIIIFNYLKGQPLSYSSFCKESPQLSHIQGKLSILLIRYFCKECNDFLSLNGL